MMEKSVSIETNESKNITLPSRPFHVPSADLFQM